MIQEVLIIKKICKRCGNEIDETEYMQYIKSLEEKDGKNEIENYNNHIICSECLNDNTMEKKDNVVGIKAI